MNSIEQCSSVEISKFMQEIKDQAVCLRRQNYSETSQIVTLFTQSHGKIRAMAKGARRTKSKFSGGVDLLSVGNVIFLPSRTESGLATLVEFDLMGDFSGLRRRLIPLHCAEYAASLLADFTEEADPHEDLYLAFVSSINEWQSTETPEKTLVRFELTLFREIGLAPVWHCCSLCKGPVSSSPRLSFHTKQGGILCTNCSAKLSPVKMVSHEVLKVFQNPEILDIASRDTGIEAHEILTNYAMEILGRKKPIMSFLDQLLKKK
jgi:DNA repair protein RecO (recombination protein O)